MTRLDERGEAREARKCCSALSANEGWMAGERERASQPSTPLSSAEAQQGAHRTRDGRDTDGGCNFME